MPVSGKCNRVTVRERSLVNESISASEEYIRRCEYGERGIIVLVTAVNFKVC